MDTLVPVSGKIRMSNLGGEGTITIDLEGKRTFSFQTVDPWSDPRTTLRLPNGETLAEIYEGADVSHLTLAQMTLADMLLFFAQRLHRVWRCGSSAGVNLAIQFGSVSMSQLEGTTLSLSLPANEEQIELLREAVRGIQERSS